MKKKILYLWKVVEPLDNMLEYIYLDDKGERICGNIVSSEDSGKYGRVINMGVAIKHVGTYGNKYKD